MTGSGSFVMQQEPTIAAPKILTGLKDGNGAVWIDIAAVGSAVNGIQVSNAATGNSPSIDAVGSDTNIDLLLAGAGDGVVKANASPVLTEATTRGTSFPSSPTDGMLFYRTDLFDLFQRDGTRGKWLSVRTFAYEGGIAGAITSGDYLWLPSGPQMSATLGWKLPFDMALVGMEAINGHASTTATLRVRKGGVNTNAISAAAATGSYDTSSNTDYAQNDIVSLVCSTNLASGGVWLRAIFRRRAS